jgi:hypothetical protein
VWTITAMTGAAAATPTLYSYTGAEQTYVVPAGTIECRWPRSAGRADRVDSPAGWAPTLVAR